MLKVSHSGLGVSKQTNIHDGEHCKTWFLSWAVCVSFSEEQNSLVILKKLLDFSKGMDIAKQRFVLEHTHFFPPRIHSTLFQVFLAAHFILLLI